MKQPNIDVLATTSQALAITSQILAIGIEATIIAGGFYIYRKFLAKPEISEKSGSDTVLVPEGYELVQTPKQETSFKERWEKFGRIFRAVLE